MMRFVCKDYLWEIKTFGESLAFPELLVTHLVAVAPFASQNAFEKV